MAQFGNVVIERRGVEGTVTVKGLRIFGHPAWFWSGTAVFALGAAHALVRPGAAGVHLGAALIGGLVVCIAMVGEMQRRLRRGLIVPVRKLEVYLSPAWYGGYRAASKPAAPRVRLPHRDLPRDQVRSVAITSRMVQPKDGDSYYVYGVCVVLPDEVLEVASVPRHEGRAKALAAALASLLGDVPVRSGYNDPTMDHGPIIATSLLATAYMVLVAGGGPTVGQLLPPWAGLASLLALSLLVNLVAMPALAHVMRKRIAPKVAREFGVVPSA